MAGEVRVQAVMILALNGGSSGGEKSAKDGAEADDAADGEVRRFNAAVRDIRDELAPVRAHGILELRNMVLARSPVLQAGSARLEATISLFVDMVKSPDSFVHLNAVRGLAALADAHGRLFIPRLVAMYCGGDAGSQGIPSLDEHVRVGEALMQSVRRAGMMLGEYAELVVPALLDEVRREHVDAESAVRRHSALAILAMCAETSALALHRWVGEITAVVEDILLVAEPVVRRAAVVLWQSLVRGYGDRVQRLVEPRELRRMYGVLRRTADGDTDEITQMQAHIAVADLDDLVRDQLFTQYL
ncbi:hypothetical protein IW150_002152 [Coemansia sp. RSA 2607]|nr:hypothetical protein IW150_002152 [Coemansia sp. RSA 2607]